MNTNRDLLDDAIDQVASRMTRVDDDAAMAARIVAALPERVSWFGWMVHAWVPRLAMTAMVATASLLWARREAPIDPAPAPVPPIAAAAPVTPVTAPMPLAAENAALNRTTPLEPLELLEPMEPARADFERSLVAVAALGPLDVESLIPDVLPAEASIAIAPLALTDLPLSAEFPVERD